MTVPWARNGQMAREWAERTVPACGRKALGKSHLAVASGGVTLFWFGEFMSREVTRLSVAASGVVLARHERVGPIAGFAIFLSFAVIGLGTTGWIVRSIAEARPTDTLG
jgi:hypothetical protein